jgi:putative ABC transport system permease protein
MRWHQRFFRRELTEKHLDAELRFHLDQRIADLVANGMAPKEARRRARLEFGGLDQVKEECRDVGAGRLVETLIQDIRFGLRTMFKDRGFVVAAVLALALGIGSCTAIFSVIDNVLLEPFPYVDSHRIFQIRIHDSATGEGEGRNYFSLPEFLDYESQNHLFDRTMGVWEETVLMGSSRALEPLDTDRVTGNAFEFLGVAPLIGRGILPSDALPGAPPVFVLSYKVWVKRFGMDRGIIGKTFILNDKPTTLVGIMPRRFAFWGGDIWMPTCLDRADPAASQRYFVLYGHLKPGLDPKAGEAELAILAGRFADIYRGQYPKQFDVHLDSLGVYVANAIGHALYTLLAAVGLLLLIACANVANLLLAKAGTREKELALRLTLGASRSRIVRQLIVESVLLALTGAAVGCLFALAELRGLIAVLPQFTFPDEAVISENTRVLLATVAIAMLATVIFGLAPALAASRRDLNEPLKAASRGSTGGGRMRSMLVVGEVALSFLLLTGAGLLMRSFFLERAVALGIPTDHLSLTGLSLPPQRYKGTESQARFVRELLSRVEGLPGVASAAAAVDFPPRGGMSTDFDVAGVTHSQRWTGDMVPCTWQLFNTLSIRLLAGRLLTPADEDEKRKVGVVNQAMSSRYFGRRNPIGRQVQVSVLKSGTGPAANAWFQVVGVVSDVKNRNLREAAVPEIYLPYTVAGFSAPQGFSLFVRTAGNPAALSAPLTSVILDLDREIVPTGTFTLDDVLEINEYARPRFTLFLFSVFAAIGLVLVSVGVYSVMSYSVTQQRREIGIRIALGASARDVRSMVLRGGLRWILAGIGIGILFAFTVGRVLASQIWGVSWYDPLTFSSLLIVLTIAGLGASYLPSVRATRVDPAISLRYE